MLLYIERFLKASCKKKNGGQIFFFGGEGFYREFWENGRRDFLKEQIYFVSEDAVKDKADPTKHNGVIQLVY